jgi:anti-sigma-K factor RskA
MKRIIGAIAAGIVAFAGVYALAASLTLGTAPTLGANTQTIAACTSDTVTVSFAAPSYIAGAGYEVGTVTATDSNATQFGPSSSADCNGHAYSVTLYGTGGTSLGVETGTVPATGDSFTTTAFSAVVAANVTGVAVEIS